MRRQGKRIKIFGINNHMVTSTKTSQKLVNYFQLIDLSTNKKVKCGGPDLSCLTIDEIVKLSTVGDLAKLLLLM